MADTVIPIKRATSPPIDLALAEALDSESLEAGFLASDLIEGLALCGANCDTHTIAKLTMHLRRCGWGLR